MIVYNLSEEEVSAINDSTQVNAELYVQGEFNLDSFLRNNDFTPQDSRIEIRDIDFNIYDPNPADTDFENAVKLYEAMNVSVAPYTASSGAFWTAMTHANLEYMAYRWPLNEEDPLGRLNERYIIDWSPSRRSRERNGMCRLWWAVYLSVLPDDESDPYLLTREIMSIQDVIMQVLDRDAFTPKITRAFGRVMLNERKVLGRKLDRKEYRPLMRYIYTMDGTAILDALTEEELVSRLTEYLHWYKRRILGQTAE